MSYYVYGFRNNDSDNDDAEECAKRKMMYDGTCRKIAEQILQLHSRCVKRTEAFLHWDVDEDEDRTPFGTVGASPQRSSALPPPPPRLHQNVAVLIVL